MSLTSLLDECEVTGPPESEFADEPVASAVPTLLASVELDPFTPLKNEELILPGLKGGQSVTLPSVGHDPLGAAGDSGASILAGLLVSPETPAEVGRAATLETDYSPEPPGGTATLAA